MNFSMVSLIAMVLASATPLALGGIGGLFGERSGIANIGLEGTMTIGAFAAVLGSYYTDNPWVGLVCGMLAGILISAVHAFFCVTLNVDHSVIGLAVNILAASVTVYLSSLIFGNKGFTANVAKLPLISIPVISKIPVIGPIFSELSILTIIAVIVAVLGAYLLQHTKFGLHTIAAGEAPEAAYVAGVNVRRTQYIAVMMGGLTCGLAGTFLSISYLSMYVKGMVAGRGFIALAAIIFGKHHPTGVLLASLFFGLADALQISLQGMINVPNELIQCMPYVLTIAAVAFNEWRNIKQKNMKTTIQSS